MRRGHRRTATRVVGGRPLKKNNWKPDRGDYHALDQAEIRLDRRDPGPGFRHLLTIAQLRDFLALLPDWDDVAIGLDAIVLAEGGDSMGWHRYAVVAVCAWEQDLWWTDVHPWFEEEHARILDLLEVERVKVGGRVEARWTEAQARAFQLLHILPHELGHHRDRMTTRRRQRPGRGEPFAERYALEVLERVWPVYDPS